MVETHYDAQFIATAFVDYAQSVNAKILDNSFTRKRLPGESVHSITAILGDDRHDEDVPYLSIYLKPDRVIVDLVGFNFVDEAVNHQLELCKIVFNSHLTYRRYTKKRLNPFKPDYIYELTIEHHGSELTLSRRDSEIKDLKTEEALKQL